MKIGVASDDGVSIAGHFGRCASFVVFDVEDGKVTGKEVRANANASRHAEHGYGEQHGHAEGHGGAAAHSHASILNALAGCDAVLCRGMGWRAAEDLKVAGITPLVVEGALSIEDAVTACASGTLKTAKFCRCHE